MRFSPPQAFSFVRNGGLPGTTVRTSLLGTGLHRVTSLRFSGSGIMAAILGTPSAIMLDVAISIDAQAAPGPRSLTLSYRQGGHSADQLTGVLFHVLAASGYASTIGIGSHLI